VYIDSEEVGVCLAADDHAAMNLARIMYPCPRGLLTVEVAPKGQLPASLKVPYNGSIGLEQLKALNH